MPCRRHRRRPLSWWFHPHPGRRKEVWSWQFQIALFSRLPQASALWHGLLTVPPASTEGLRRLIRLSVAYVWHGRETVPQQGNQNGTGLAEIRVCFIMVGLVRTTKFVTDDLCSTFSITAAGITFC